MIGEIDPSQGRATVVGAGVAGLLIAYELDRRGYEVTLLEAAPRAGGLIATARTERGIAESAAHSFLATPRVQELCQDLGVDLVPVNPDAKARYVLRNGQLRRFPLTIWEAICAFVRAYLVLSDRGVKPESMTLESWARRFLGQPVLDYLLNPFLRGIYAAKPSEIGLMTAFPSLRVPPGHSFLSWMVAKKLTRRKQFPPAPRGKMMAPLRGMGDLVERLEARLEARLGSRFRRGEKVSALPNGPNLVLAVPADVASELVLTRAEAGSPASLRDAGQALAEIRYTALVSVTAFIRNSAFPGGKPPKGVGVLMPEKEGRKILGVLFNSSSFPERVKDPGLGSYTIMLGGSQSPERASASDAEISQIVTSELREIFEIQGEPEELRIHRWPRAIPVYGPELLSIWSRIQIPGVTFFGNYTGQVSLRGMIESLSRVPARRSV